MEVNAKEESAQVKGSNGTSDKLKLFTIENVHGIRLVVSNIGAAVVSLFTKDRTGRLSDIVLGYENPVDYLNDEFYLGTVIGRYANRIAGSTVVIDGQTYRLSTKEGDYHQHGGTLGFNKKIFETTMFQKNKESGVIFKYTSPHLEEGFPGRLQLEVVYTLDDYDTWTVEYKATSSQATLINLTQHSYFNLSGILSESVDDHEVKIISNYYLPVNKMQVPTGKLQGVKNTPFDFSKFKQIGKDINGDNHQLKISHGYDHTFVLEKEHSEFLKHAAIVKNEFSGRKLDVFTTEPALHFYTGNFLRNVNGKNGIVYNQRSGFCLETQHFPDAPNNPNFPSTLLKARDEFYSKTIFKFSVEP